MLKVKLPLGFRIKHLVLKIVSKLFHLHNCYTCHNPVDYDCVICNGKEKWK